MNSKCLYLHGDGITVSFFIIIRILFPRMKFLPSSWMTLVFSGWDYRAREANVYMQIESAGIVSQESINPLRYVRHSLLCVILFMVLGETVLRQGGSSIPVHEGFAVSLNLLPAFSYPEL